MPVTLKGRENLHTVYCYGHPLGVVCRICDHRALLSVSRLGAYRGNMRAITDLRLKCTLCGSDRYTPVLFPNQAEVDAFLPKPVEGSGPSF
jgi:hypothetical protein